MSSEELTAEKKNEKKLHYLSYLPQWPPVNISFEDVNFLVEDGINNKRPILRSLSGKFSSGQLIAIMGPSGDVNLIIKSKSYDDNSFIYIFK